MRDTGKMAAAAVAAWAAMSGGVYAACDDTIQIALVGCGGRGTGAAVNALSTTLGPTKLVAMADVFADKMSLSYKSIERKLGAQVDVPEDRALYQFRRL